MIQSYRNIKSPICFAFPDKSPSEATFRGAEFMSYRLTETGGEAVVSSTEEISLYFKTRHPDGLLFFTGEGEDFLNLALKDGGVIVTMNLGAGTLERTLKPSRVRFNDNQWHKITVHRKIQEITRSMGFCHLSVNVDGVYMERGSTAGSFTILSSSVLYVGGSDKTASLPGARVRSNFMGCLRKVMFTADSLILNILELARTGNSLLLKRGNINFQCQEVEAADPITFTTKESFLALPSWEAARSGSLSFKMRTNEPNGLIMYNAGASKSVSDFFAFELLDGHVYLLMNLGSGVVKVKATNRRMDDGHWHIVSLRRHNKSGRVSVDDVAADFNTPGNSNQLDLKGDLFLGGVGTRIEAIPIPSEIWSGNLGYGYVGCIRDLVVNRNAVDIADYARKQDSGSIRPACHTLPQQCDSQPCNNNGKCKEGWNRFICDCTHTEYTGPVCAKYATTLSFDGSQFMMLKLPEPSSTQSEDVILRFRTNRPNSLLLAMSAERSNDRLQMMINTGRITLAIDVEDGHKVLQAGQGLNDHQWHTVHLRRRGQRITLKVDNEPGQYDEIPETHQTLHFNALHIGSVKHIKTALHQHPVPNFIGLMQQLVFNGRQFFELARNGQISDFEVTAKFGKKEQTVHHPVTFKTRQSFVGLPQLKAYSSMNLYFQFKTLQANGLIMYHAGKGQDFLAVELVNGHLHYIFNIGDGSRRVRSNTKSTLNDNRWHAVTIGRPSLRQHSLMVDDMIATVTSTGNNVHLDLDGVLYVGGVPIDMYSTKSLPRFIKSDHGFQGCLGSLDLNGFTPDPVVDSLVPDERVVSGCDGPITKCGATSCSKKGVCVQLWNTYTCDCDMTSYGGPTCSDESIAYQFGRAGGTITYSYPENKRPDSRNDLLALGLMTYTDDAIIARVDSSSSNDYMELEIVEGNIFVVYNMGTDDHPIEELKTKINDGRYHVIRFTRSGSNSTLQVDDQPVQMKNPHGQQLSVFNSQSHIQIGGKNNVEKKSVERPFNGIVAGFVFNGQRILDMASEDDADIKISGDAELLLSIPFDSPQRYISAPSKFRMMKETPSKYGGGVDDDLVFSGGGSGCADDEDNCMFINSGSGDDLITPVYIPPPTPKVKITTSRPGIKGSANKPCSEDDEDCLSGVEGSGFEEIAVPPKPSKKPDDSTKKVGHRPKSTTTTSTKSPHHVVVVEMTKSPIEVEPPFDEYFPTEKNDLDIGIIAPTDIEKSYVPNMGYNPIQPPINYDQDYTGVRGGNDNAVDTAGSKNTRPKSRSAETLTLVVGIVAGVMVAVVIIAFLVYRFRNRPEGSYKIDESKNYRFSSDPGTLSISVSGYMNGSQTQMNGAVKNGGNGGGGGDKAGKLPKKKDVKEWYV
ncbi:NRXN2 (predicted) [Pycnogonum litorale]